MSYSGSNAHELTARLLAALDPHYDVLDMHAVNEIISVLEKIHITKELLETTRLGKHVNLLRRRARDPSLARRAKVLVKRWRDLVIPGSAQQRPHAGSQANRTSAERQVRPLTSPALARHVVSPAVSSPRSTSRPGWSGYDSDSQDVILVDDDPAPPPPPPPPAAPPAPPPPARRPGSPLPSCDAKRAKRDKKPKKKRGHSRAGSGAEAAVEAPAWARNGGSPPAPPAPPAPPPARRNGCRRPQPDAYSALVHRMPPAGSKKVKTTQELLEQIQSRGPALSAPVSPAASPGSPDVQLIESPEHVYAGKASPLRNGGESPLRARTPPARSPPAPPPAPPDDEPRAACTCSEDAADDSCEAARRARLQPAHVHALHHARVPGVNGTRAPPARHPHAVRAPAAGEPALFASVVPLYRYLDYADDYCTKNQSRVDLCPWLRRDQFAPSPPPPPAPPSPPPPRPYPLREPSPPVKCEPASDDEMLETPEVTPLDRVADDVNCDVEMDESRLVDSEINYKPDSIGINSPERLRPPDLEPSEMDVDEEPQGHRTVERTKEGLDGRSLYGFCERAIETASLDYRQAFAAPLVPFETDAVDLEDAFTEAELGTERDDLGRPVRSTDFAEWHEAARLTEELIALPYVVID